MVTRKFGEDLEREAAVKEAAEVETAVENLAGNEDIAERAKKIVADFDAKMNDNHERREEWELLEALYDGESIGQYQDELGCHIPIIPRSIENAVSRVLKNLFSNDPWFKATGQTPDDDEGAECITDLLAFQMRQDHLRTKLVPAFKSCVIKGTLIAKTSWVRETKTVWYRDVVSGEDADGRPTRSVSGKPKKREVVVQRPTWWLVPLERVFFDPELPIQEGPGVTELFSRSLEDLIQMQEMGVYENVDKLREEAEARSKGLRRAGTVPLGQDLLMDSTRNNRMTRNGLRASFSRTSPTGQRVLLREFWGPFDIDDSGREVECVITTAGFKDGMEVVLRVSRNPYWHGERPYVKCALLPVEGVEYGATPVKWAAPLSMELDTHHNIGLLGAAMESSPMMAVSQQSGIREEDAQFHPGRVWIVPNIDRDMKPFSINRGGAAVAFSTVQSLEMRLTETLATPNLFSGAEGNPYSTATSVSSRLQEANVSIEEMLRNLQDNFLNPILRHWHAMNKQYLTDEMQIRVLGARGASNPYRTISPTEIACEVDFDFQTTEDIGLAGMKAQHAINLVGQVGALVKPEEVRSLIRLALDNLVGWRKSREVMPDDDAKTFALEPADEYELVLCDQAVKVHVDDDDREHISAHVQQLNLVKEDARQQALVAHIKNHVYAATAKERAAAAAQQQAPPTQGGLGLPGGQQAPMLAVPPDRMQMAADQANMMAPEPGGLPNPVGNV